MQTKSLSLRRALSAALLVLLLSVVGITKGYASYNFSAVCSTGQTLYYKITNTTNRYVELTCPGTANYSNCWLGYTKPSGEILLPETVQNNGITYTVTSIGKYAFCCCSGLTGSLSIPNTVTIIGENAFQECNGFTGSLIIGNSVVAIESAAFWYCSEFTGSLNIPNSVTSIGAAAFRGLIGMTGNLIIGNSVVTIGDGAFMDCNGFTGDLTIPNSVTTIGNYAFEYCSGFAGKLTIGNSVTSIDLDMFEGCRGWGQIEILEGNPYYDSRGNCNAIIETNSNQLILGCKNTVISNSITSIGYSAFDGCTSLISITIPSSVTSIGYSAFANCSGLEQIVVADGNPYYDSRDNCNAIIQTNSNALMFGCKNTVIPPSVTEIGWRAFEGCTGLTSISIPNSVTEIGSSAFEGCTSISTIVIPNSVSVIDYFTFYGCSSLSSVTIPNSVITIQGSAFKGCVSLATITIPNSVTMIGSYAFEDCIGLTSITIPNSVITIEDGAFYGCSGLTGNLAIPNSVSTIGSYAFYGCSGLTGSLIIGNSVTTIGNYAFKGCSGFGSIISFAVTPPSVGANTFRDVNHSIPITVFCGTITTYQNASGWNQFNNYLEVCLPELHVTGITHSEFMAGQQVTISWTVQNDGTTATPNGEIWHDRVWLSVESRVAADDNNPILLGTFDNLSALDVGEYYTQTQTFDIPIDIVGEYYLFVLTDAYDAYSIFWENNQVPIPYNPPPYIGCLSHHCPNCINVADNRIYELSESEHGLYNDNFFYTLVDIAAPFVPDLQATSIIPPNNFFSGTDVNVTATIGNLGDITTLTSSWTDALYVSNEPDFSSATCIATTSHSGALPVGDSYQVTFTGRVPITMYGEAYFFVQTDCYGQVYEHIWNHNNVAMSEVVNIILTPPADLEPSGIVTPALVSTGESFAYGFKVFNVGVGNPNVNSWQDRVYLSQNANTIGEHAVLLKTHQHQGGLAPGTNYSVSESLALPSTVSSGNYYLYVVADANNQVFEYLYDGNNTTHSLQITITTPDLQVTQISAPEQITAGYPLNFSYTLTNAGEGDIDNRMVTDRVYISASGNISDTIRIANIRRNVYLLSGQSLTVMCNDLAPYSLTDGTYHLIVLTDSDNDINESNEGNNTYSHYPMVVFHQPLPDLQPVSLTIPSIIQAGETIPVEFDIINNGDLNLLNSSCTFNIYAAWDDKEILCPVQSQTLPLGSYVSIGIGETMHFVRSILLPPIVTSTCSTFELMVNKGGLVPELDTTNNVFTVSASVLDCPLPDLVIANIAAMSVQAGAENQISFTVKNIGTADFEGQFNTMVYVRSANDTILCPLVLQVNPLANSYSISVGGTLEFTQNVLIPPMANASCCILEVMVDEENLVLEADDNNNATTLDASVVNYPFDLKTMTLQVQGSVWAGETTSLTWTVKNIGTCPSETIPLYVMRNGTYTLVQGEILPQPWTDKVYISTDAVLSDDDTELCSVARSTVLHPNDTYTVEQSVTLPYTNLGVQYLLCISDATQVTYDSDTLNNVKAIPIEVQLGSLPDLRITSFTVGEEMTSDRAYWMYYTVVNEGERVTQQETWVDAFYIGEFMTYLGALQLGSKIHHGALEVGETYTDSIEIIIPNGLVGDYFLMGYTDITNQVYEHENEVDNLLSVPVAVWAPAPCDLVAIQPEIPNYVVSGEEMTVSWQLRNNGYNPALGRIRNAVYLSTDATWSSDDRMLGYADININIAGSEQLACSLTGTLTGVAEGDYYVIVKANILNALNELSYENNVCVSLLMTEVGFPLLVIGEEVDRTMATDQYIYYKMEVGSELEGQTLSCRLITTEQQVANGIYLSHDAVPTLSQFDYSQYLPYAQELEILIPALEQGNYYLLAKGNTHNGNPQQINIATSIINFEILSIDADHGANAGSVTTKVTGAKFDSIMDFRLVRNGDYLPAEKVFFSNSTQTFTTFDLVGMPAGTYDMVAELPGGVITIKGDAFTIEEGLPAELTINIVAPASVRRGNTFAVNIEYGNIGTTDLNVSGFVVVSRNGHPIGFTTEALTEGLTELTFDTGETNGNPDVMRPGYRNTRTIMVKATLSTDVSLAVYAIRRQY